MGQQFLGHQVRVAVIVDAVMVVLFGIYLLSRRKAAERQQF